MATLELMPGTQSGKSGRELASRTLGRVAKQYPALGPTVMDLDDAIEPRDRRLALAITRTALQRWITIEYLLDRVLDKPMHLLEPALRGVLLSAGAQLVFMDRLPAHAVVDESVELGGRLVRAGAKGLINAVLRRLTGIVSGCQADQQWSPAADRLPLDHGSVKLSEPYLPDPGDDLEAHLEVATSHPRRLIRRLVGQFGPEQVIGICRCGVRTPARIVAVEDGFVRDDSKGIWRPHEQDGFIEWLGEPETPTKTLTEFLAGHLVRRVQDPGAARPVQATGEMQPETIIDLCAGRGTKTVQCAALHRSARIWASDANSDRLDDLKQVAALTGMERVKVMTMGQLIAQAGSEPVDLVMADVPCTNTAVLSRRPEARYRFSDKTLRQLVEKQQKILDQAAALVRPGGHLLYSTCSLLQQENQDQAQRLCERAEMRIVAQEQALPRGVESTHIDGGYFALLQKN